MSESNVKYTEAEALEFHSHGRPGKIEIIASKPMATQRDLALAYSPGVAVPVRAIADNPGCAYDYTSKGNLVAVIEGVGFDQWRFESLYRVFRGGLLLLVEDFKVAFWGHRILRARDGCRQADRSPIWTRALSPRARPAGDRA